jgi:hypothetical protein
MIMYANNCDETASRRSFNDRSAAVVVISERKRYRSTHTCSVASGFPKSPPHKTSGIDKGANASRRLELTTIVQCLWLVRCWADSWESFESQKSNHEPFSGLGYSPAMLNEYNKYQYQLYDEAANDGRCGSNGP